MNELGAVLAAVAEHLGPPQGAPVPLEGGITNRNFRIRFAQGEFVLRLPGRQTELLGISRAAERIAGARAAELGFGPQVKLAGHGFLLTEYIPARPADPAALLADPAPVARALRSFHDCGTELPVRFWVPDLLDAYAEIAVRRGRELPAAYAPTQALSARIATALPLHEMVPTHNDLLPGNLLHAAGGRVVLVDWEYAGMGHRLFDLGNLAVNNDFDGRADVALLGAYFGEPPSESRRAALALMRILSDAREAAWGVVQSAVSELDFDFRGYAEKHFARLLAAADDSRLERWLTLAAEHDGPGEETHRGPSA